METKRETVQSVLAKLITTPAHTVCDMNNSEKLLSPFNLSENDKKLLIQFFENYGEKFRASTILLRKRRWDNIKQSLQLVTKIFKFHPLEQYWDAYLKQLTYFNKTPKNPLIESVQFCEFLLTLNDLPVVYYPLIEYEKTRNQTIINYSLDFNDYKNNNKNILIHPCYIIKDFNCNISELVKLILLENLPQSLEKTYALSNESILFYKNWRKGGVATLKITPVIKNFIFLITQGNTFSSISESLNLSKEVFDRFLKKLIDCGLII
jgi:hypothetical protein